MRFVITALVLLISAALSASAFAVGPGKTLEYAGGAQGKVILDGKVHADKGLKCTECHTKIWPMKKGPDFKMADMNAGKYCGVCHNGTKAFSTKDAANCSKCHTK